MSYPTYYISSSVVNVDTETTSKIIMLPPASTILGTSLYIRDAAGFASTSTVYVSTQQFDFLDNVADTILLNTNFQSLRIAPWSTTRYSLLTNYIQNLEPFTYQLQPFYTFFSRLNYNFNSTAVSASGETIVVTATGSSAGSNGIYVSVNTGNTFTKTQTLDGCNNQNDSSCMSYSGKVMFVTLDLGPIYRSGNYGSNWTVNTNYPYPYKAIACTSNGDSVYTLTDSYVFKSSDKGETFELILDYIEIGYPLRSICVGTIDSQDTAFVYVGTAGDRVYQYDGRSWNGFGPGGIWQKLACNSNGDIVYGILSDNMGDFLYKSSNRGRSWAQLTALTSYNLVRCDATGQIVTVTGEVGPNLYVSVNGGSNFTVVNPALTATDIAISGDGNYIVAVQNPGTINVGRGRLV